MTVSQLIFAICLVLTLAIFTFTITRIIRFFSLTKKGFPIRNIPARIALTLNIVFGQTKIFRRPVIGLLHALVFWGFCVILIGSIEMVIDGLTGLEKSLQFLGIGYSIITATGDIFAFIILISIAVFLFRRLFMHIPRFEGIEMKAVSHRDANLALSIIFLLMLSLLGMNTFYVQLQLSSTNEITGAYPVSSYFASLFKNMDIHSLHIAEKIAWWTHILLIFIFANILPYSKHFHVFMSVPNVFLSRLEPLGKLPNMESITREVKLILNPDMVPPAEETPVARFGVKDVEDVTWKNYFDSLSCTECGRCTSVCPANITGKKLSPRKVMMDLRARMKEKGPGLLKDKNFTDNKSLVRDYISEEELWACTTCNACAQECPININHPTLIVDMRRYLVLEEGSAPGELKAIFNNIENNGAPWQFSPEDRLLWAKGLN